MRRTRVLRQLIEDSLYVVDERLVAEAILLRAQARANLPGLTLPNDRGASIRSFRLEHDARSFRLGGRTRSRQLHH
jgi:hypothetical protein